MANVLAEYPSDVPQFTQTTATNWTLQATGDYLAFIRQAEEDATITSVSGYHDLITGAPGTVRVGIQTLNSSGIPSGTWSGWADFTANTSNFPNFAAFKKTLTTNATLTRGQFYAIVFATNGGTWNASNSMRFWSVAGNSTGETARSFPYTYGIANAVTQAKSTTAITANCACSSSTEQYGFAGSVSNVTAWSSASTPDERGVKFNLPTGSCTSFKVRGIRFLCGITNSASTWDLVLYNSAGTVLQSTSFTNTASYNTASILLRDFYFSNSTLSTLSPNTDYRVVIKPTSSTLGSLTYNAFSCGWDMTRSMVSDGTWSYTSRTDAGAWTDDPNTALPMKLLLEDVTSSGGGAIIQVGMTGGIRG